MDTLGTYTHICHQHPPTHTTRGSEGAYFDKRIIPLLTQPIPLKTKEESYTNTLQPSEANNTHAPRATYTNLHTRTPAAMTLQPPVVTKKRLVYAVICVSVSACQGRAVRVNSCSHMRQVTGNKRQEKRKKREARVVPAAQVHAGQRRGSRSLLR